jgi:hypothetical protein
MPQQGRDPDGRSGGRRKWYELAGGLLFWAVVLIWLACILYPWIAR